MATLAGNTIAATYPLLLKIDSTLDGNLEKVESGDATDSALSLSTTAMGIDSADKLYFDTDQGTPHTYIHERIADRLDFVVGGQTILELGEGGGGASDLVAIQALNKFYFDGGSDTYIQESAADTLSIVVGGIEMIRLDETNNKLEFRTYSPRIVSSNGTSADAALYYVSHSSATETDVWRVYMDESTSNTMRWLDDVNDLSRMLLSTAGLFKVGNGVLSTSMVYPFYCQGNIASNFAAVIQNTGDNTNRKGLEVIMGADDAAGTNYAITISDGDGDAQGHITQTDGSVAVSAFTANHNGSIPDADNDDGYPYGTLLDIKNLFYRQKNDANLERAIMYNTEKSSSAYSRKILGAYAGKHTVEPEREYIDGEVMPSSKSPGDIKPALNLNNHLIYILGDGHVLCNNEKGNIVVGDGITSSSTAGIGMKTDKTCMIIGIAQEDVTFSGSETKLVAVQYGVRQFTPWTD